MRIFVRLGLALRVSRRRTGSGVNLEASPQQPSLTPGDEFIPEQRVSAPSLILVPPEHHSYVRAVSPGSSRRASKRRLIPVVLIFSEAVLALFVWWLASVVQGVWGQGALSAMSVATLAPVAVGWVAIRALLGLYPGYGLDSVERLRRHTYSTFATLALLAIFAVAFQVGDRLSRLLLVLVFLGLLVLGPFAEHLTRWVMKRIGWWGKPVVVLGYSKAGTEVAGLLKEEWELGYDPVTALDYRLDESPAEPLRGVGGQKGWAGVVDLVANTAWKLPSSPCHIPAASTWWNWSASLASASGRLWSYRTSVGSQTRRCQPGTSPEHFAVEIKYNLLDPGRYGQSGHWTS